MKRKNKLTVWSIGIKKKSKNVMFWSKKGHIKGDKHIARMDFAEHLRKSNYSENSKVCYGRFLRNGLDEWYCYIKKSRWDVPYLEVCWLLFIGREIKMEFDGQSFCWSLPLTIYYAPPLLRGAGFIMQKIQLQGKSLILWCRGHWCTLDQRS